MKRMLSMGLVWLGFWGATGAAFANGDSYEVYEPALPRFLLERCYPQFRALFALGTGLEALKSRREGNVEFFQVSVSRPEEGGGRSRASLEMKIEKRHFVTVVTCADVVDTESSGRTRSLTFDARPESEPWDGQGPDIPFGAVRIDVISGEFLRTCYGQVRALLDSGERFESAVMQQRQASVFESPQSQVIVSVSRNRESAYQTFALRAEVASAVTQRGTDRYVCGEVGAAGVIRYAR